MCVCAGRGGRGRGRGDLDLDVVVGTADIGVILHIEAGVEVELQPEAGLHLDEVQTLGTLRIRSREVDAGQHAGAFAEHGTAALHCTKESQSRLRSGALNQSTCVCVCACGVCARAVCVCVCVPHV